MPFYTLIQAVSTSPQTLDALLCPLSLIPLFAFKPQFEIRMEEKTMRFNHKSLKNLLKRQQEKEHPILLKAGISTADIQKLFDFENHQLNRDRA